MTTDPSPLRRRFFERPAEEVAPDLLGLLLTKPGEGTAARIVEVEAYGPRDPASHAHNGRTTRNATMFGAAGHAYLYFIYGMHWCANVVTGPEGVGSAVLLRAAEVVEGEHVMRQRRGDVTDRDLLRGPARLTKAFDLDGRHDGVDLLGDGEVKLVDDGVRVAQVATGPRVGVRLAADVPWRFWIAGHSGVSRYVRSPRAT